LPSNCIYDDNSNDEFLKYVNFIELDSKGLGSGQKWNSKDFTFNVGIGAVWSWWLHVCFANLSYSQSCFFWFNSIWCKPKKKKIGNLCYFAIGLSI